ncbi:hypothetical protein BH24ACI5_BH24ACI5_20510 [soil metagenome]
MQQRPWQRHGSLWVLLAGGALGFHLGYTRFPDWQGPVETAQVLAGLVSYPHETPFYIYHVKLWTLLHQICALLLLSGVSEIALSRLLSGVMGMLSFQALAMFGYAFSRVALASVGAAVLVFVSETVQAGAVYPIFLMGVPFTYGVIGLSLIVLIATLVGGDRPRAGAFLLGLAPAVHPSLGFWLWVVIGASLLFDRQMREALRPAARPLLAGAAVTAASLGLHLVMASGVPAGPVESSRVYFDVFVALWDGHRRPIALTETAVLLNAAALVLASVWLRWFRHEVPPSAARLLRFVQVSAVIGVLLVPLSWIQPDRLPVTLLILMPGRVLNINALTFTMLLFGLLGASGAAWRHGLMLLLAVGLLAGRASMLWRLFPGVRPGWIAAIETHWLLFAIAGALLAGAAIERGRRGHAAEAPTRTQPPRHGARTALRIVTLGVFVSAATVAYRVPEDRSQLFIDRTNNYVLGAASRSPGLLLTSGDVYQMQLRTRRPHLIEVGALDTVAYMPETAPAMHRILRDIYGVDFFDPPAELRGTGMVTATVHRERWQRFTVEDWREIRKTYHVTQVLTSTDMELALPIVAGDRRLLLYAIPE